ncbi:MAG: ComF family protein [Deltaproteobacteria bacterium]|nr:ComF family protein [Deltaproteobacteria bacterium]
MRGRDLLDAVLPTVCVSCGALAGEGPIPHLCASCAEALPRSAWPLATRIPCLKSAWCLLPYEGLGGQLVRRGKYGGREVLLAELAEYTARAAAPVLPLVGAVVAVPSPPARVAARGFSAPHLLAGAVARRLGVPHVRALHRHRGPRQAGLARRARGANVAGAFTLSGPFVDEPVLLLVDDVVTTGATASACAQVLLVGGARAVHLLAFAAALP